jgi:hypothetical protein
VRDRCNVRTVWASIGLRLSYDPRDVCGTCRHDHLAVLGSKMSTSGTRGLGFPVGCASDQARRWCTTEVCVPCTAAECRRRLDSGYSRASCRQINTGKCLDPPLTNIILHYSCTFPLQAWVSYATQIGGCNCSVRHPHKQSLYAYDQNFCGNQWSFSFLATSCSTFWTLVR